MNTINKIFTFVILLSFTFTAPAVGDDGVEYRGESGSNDNSVNVGARQEELRK